MSVKTFSTQPTTTLPSSTSFIKHLDFYLWSQINCWYWWIHLLTTVLIWKISVFNFHSPMIFRGRRLHSLSIPAHLFLLLLLFLLFTAITTAPLTARVTFTAVILLLNWQCLQHTQRSGNSIWAKTTKPITQVAVEAAFWLCVKNLMASEHPIIGCL